MRPSQVEFRLETLVQQLQTALSIIDGSRAVKQTTIKTKLGRRAAPELEKLRLRPR